MADETRVRVAGVGELGPGENRVVEADGRSIAVFNVEGRYYAIDNVCPHRGGPLAEGDIIGDEIVCPWHLWGFDVRSGLCPGNAEYTIATHEVKVDGGRILVRLAPVRETSGVL